MYQVACHQGIATLITLSTGFIGADLTRPCSEHLPSVPTTVTSSVIYYVPAAGLCGPARPLDMYYKYSETINRGTQTSHKRLADTPEDRLCDLVDFRVMTTQACGPRHIDVCLLQWTGQKVFCVLRTTLFYAATFHSYSVRH